MKHLIFAVINRHDVTEETLEALSDAGFNGTVITSSRFEFSITIIAVIIFVVLAIGSLISFSFS